MGSTYEGLMKIKDAIGTPEEDIVLENIFPTFQSESIDYGIMEKRHPISIFCRECSDGMMSAPG